MQANFPQKPLNILLYFDFDQESLDQEKYQKITEFCKSHLEKVCYNKYAVITPSLEELNEKAWISSIKHIIVIHNKENEYSPSDHYISLRNLSNENKLIVISVKDVEDNDLENFIETKYKEKTGLYSKNFNIPVLTKHFVYLSNKSFSEKIENYFKDAKIEYEICDNLEDIKVNFDFKKFFSLLNLYKLKVNLIISDVTTSTQTILEGLDYLEDLVVISDQQLNGRGRGINKWISPKGMICFSMTNKVPKDTKLFKNLTFYQHLVSLAIIHSIESFIGSNKLDIKIKWPNDIFFQSKYKVCGILVTSKIEGDFIVFSAGIGINYGNKEPSVSLKEIVEEYLNCDDVIPKEDLIVTIMAKIEKLIKLFNSGGKDQIVKNYYEKWFLSNKKILLKNIDVAVIKGIDSDGFLEVEYKNNIVSLNPDSNRFDILQNLTVKDPEI